MGRGCFCVIVVADSPRPLSDAQLRGLFVLVQAA
nr:MAG TPA: hypothetical protein [Caudoviricetes sp.]